MCGSTRFPGCGFRRCHSDNTSHSGYSENYGSDPQDRRRRYAALAEQEAYMRALHAQQSRFGSSSGFQSLFVAHGERNPFIDRPQYGACTRPGIAFGLRFMRSGVGIMSTQPFVGRTTDMGLDIGGNLERPHCSSFFASTPTNFRNPTFNMTTHQRRHPDSTSRPDCSQRSWLHSQRSPFRSQFFDDDDDDDNESDYNMMWAFEPSSQRRGNFCHLGQSTYRPSERSRRRYDFQDPYDYIDIDDDDDDDDDDNEFEDFYLMNERQCRY